MYCRVMALQEFDPGSNLSEDVENGKKTVIIIKIKLMMMILRKAKSNTSMSYSSKYCNPAIVPTLLTG